MIDIFTNKKPDVQKKVNRRSQNETRTSTVSILEKLICQLWRLRFAILRLSAKTYTVNNAEKWTKLGVLKDVTFKNFDFLKWTILVNITSRERQRFFFISDGLSTIFNHLGSSKLEILVLNVFGGDIWCNAYTVSYSKHCYLQQFHSERCCSFFRSMFKKLVLFRTRK